MLVVRIVSYISFCVAGVSFVLAIGGAKFMLLALTVSAVIAGVMMLVLDKVVTTLVEIRDAIVGQTRLAATDDALEIIAERNEQE